MRCPPHPCPRRQVVVPKGRRRLVREGGGAQDRCVVRAQCLWQDDRLGRTLGDITQVPQRIAQSLPRGREGAGRGGAGGGGWEGAGQGMAERDGLRFDVVQSHAPPPPPPSVQSYVLDVEGDAVGVVAAAGRPGADVDAAKVDCRWVHCRERTSTAAIHGRIHAVRPGQHLQQGIEILSMPSSCNTAEDDEGRAVDGSVAKLSACASV